MHIEFNPENIDLWSHYYANQAGQVGYGIVDGFRGTPYQRGAGVGSFFRSLFRMAVPVFKSAASSVGKQALSTGASIASDLVQGHPLADTIATHGREGAVKLLNEASESLRQKGRGLGSRPKSINRPANDVFANKKPANSKRRKR